MDRWVDTEKKLNLNRCIKIYVVIINIDGWGTHIWMIWYSNEIAHASLYLLSKERLALHLPPKGRWRKMIWTHWIWCQVSFDEIYPPWNGLSQKESSLSPAILGTKILVSRESESISCYLLRFHIANTQFMDVLTYIGPPSTTQFWLAIHWVIPQSSPVPVISSFISAL